MYIKKSLTGLIIGALSVCIGLTACSSLASPTSSTAASVASKQLQSSANQTSPSETPSADLSGSVVVYMPSPAGLADKLVAGFECSYMGLIWS